MAIRIVAYDLNKPGQNHAKVLKKIKGYGNWAMLSESSYAIQTQKGPQTIYNEFKPLLDQSDQLIVLTLTAPWWGQGDKDVLDWLHGAL